MALHLVARRIVLRDGRSQGHVLCWHIVQTCCIRSPLGICHVVMHTDDFVQIEGALAERVWYASASSALVIQ